MNGLRNSVSLQIQRAISEAIDEQVLPQIQASPRCVPDKFHKKGMERPERVTGI